MLALPHYLVVGVFAGGGLAIWTGANNELSLLSAGLIGLLVLFAGIMLLFTGRYPKSLYDFVLGMNRWVFRVVAYASLMTDQYPPFRLDMGGNEPPMSKAPEATPPMPTPGDVMTVASTSDTFLGRISVVADEPPGRKSR